MLNTAISVLSVISALVFLALWVLLDTHEKEYPILNTIKRGCFIFTALATPYVMVVFRLFENAM